jgi:hypothetical protein
MSTHLTKITDAIATRHADAKLAADACLARYLVTGKFIEALAFDRAAEAQQLLAHRGDAVQRLAKAWRK